MDLLRLRRYLALLETTDTIGSVRSHFPVRSTTFLYPLSLIVCLLRAYPLILFCSACVCYPTVLQCHDHTAVLSLLVHLRSQSVPC
ncbi:uncharacterized protein STEHIDRAFT_145697 [Stereum hirsutum FP-91666 SS1]|uniref:uncharacterized protein n=1 Tax=Stereum hirsutum (strain FP-91666) TaxID=721885 RepID=UPI000440A948|nr:uncharacterized protein STEHIDRAFT_145697 [Stereum hirsutum FP-91666 SS1]EIM88880.1 hypothetical protein STEHIDRAFT_145697 [Stereum hirsutum FP-91666 SS1]